MYDLKEIKTIPCGDVAKKYGIELKEKHGRLWGKLRPEENTDSFSINLKNNLWYDFGSAKGGSVIDLVVEVEGISSTDAINKLAQEYGFEQEKTIGWRPLTDRQYNEIGIQTERATMNFAFDLNKHSIEQLERWSNKYGMHVKDLAEKYPKIYNQMVETIGMRKINELREIYNTRVKKYHNPDTHVNDKEFIREASKEAAEEINRKVDLLQKAVTNSKDNYNYLRVNYTKDFKPLEQQAKGQQAEPISADEKVREKVVKIYKKLFNCQHAESFTVEQAKALLYINRAITNADNKYIPITGIRQLYSNLGQNLDKLEKDHNNALKGKEETVNKIKDEIVKVKELFNKCNVVLEGIRETNLAQKNELAKQNTNENSLNKHMEYTL